MSDNSRDTYHGDGSYSQSNLSSAMMSVATPSSTTAGETFPDTGASTGTTTAAGSASRTLTLTETPSAIPEQEPEVFRLTLTHRSVQWDESVVDNEGQGRKSSKRCCIFHKQRPFGESSTDSSDQEEEDENGKKRIARPKKKDTVPDFQRYHA